MSRLSCWIEAMRLRTLPVSVAGVFAAAGYAVYYHCFEWLPALLCLLFAVTAQVASNFANEYYDYKAGLDKAGRVGPRRGVTEGDITPSAMRNATFATLALACAIGLCLLAFGGWWLLIVGAVIALGVLAYSTGPYPLSRHGLGEVAVMIFFGIIPVNLTYYLQSGHWNLWVAAGSIAVGLMGANVIIVNNYRDRDEDEAVGKRTLAVIFGRSMMLSAYVTNGFLAVLLMLPSWMTMNAWTWVVPLSYLIGHVAVASRLHSLPIRQLNPCLGQTAILMLAYALGFLICTIINS